MTAAAARLEAGQAGPLGAHVDGDGVNVAVWSRHAERIELCVFDDDGRTERARLALPARTGDVFHGRLPGAGAGLVYGLRAHGPYAPHDGHRFNPNKLLLDPYARELVGAFAWHDAVYGYHAGHPDGCDSFDTRDSAPHVPRCRVAAPIARDVERPPRPGTPWGETVLYEMHVRGFSARHPGIPVDRRGTVEGLAHPAAIAHLQRLGVTAVELLPVAAWLDELHLVRRGLTNYWGYNPVSFFAMQPALAGPRGIAAMIEAVDRLHEAGIEVILDVVFNHTAEGDERGPTLSLRGLDNASYYVPRPGSRGGYRNLSGCGNTLAAHGEAASALILDALRYWAGVVGVDGFRFDLASAIARDADGRFDPAAVPWIAALRDDPLLGRCKLVAEAWDVEGYFTGGFPAGWLEWNDRWRDDQRRFWRGDRGRVGTLATRLAGSSDLFDPARGAATGVNYLTAHDGFTLADLVSFAHRRNQANGEDNRDGAGENFSDGCGVDGPTADAAVLERRVRRMRAMLTSLLFSRGVPMLRAGDEFGATQHGNNNAYCHDGPLTWLDWPDDDAAPAPGAIDLRPLIGELARLRRALPCLRGAAFLLGATPDDPLDPLPDVSWLRPDGAPMTLADWHDERADSLAVLLDAGRPRPAGMRDRLWLAFTAGNEPVGFRLPDTPDGRPWACLLDSTGADAALSIAGGSTLHLTGPAVLACVSGSLADLERARWRPGPARPSIIAADDPGAAIEVVDDPARAAGRLQAGGGPDPAAAPIDRAIDPHRAPRVSGAIDAEGRRWARRRVALGAPLAAGMGWVRWSPDATGTGAARSIAARLVVAPRHAWLPAPLTRDAGAWALSVQVYALRSSASWGIGDFDDLARLAEAAGGIGAAGLLVSPLHAPSLGWTDRGSPYSPSSRLALNPWFVSLWRAAADFATPLFDLWLARADTQAALAAVRAADTIDYPAVTSLKREGLERLWRDFRATRDTAMTREAARAFDAWRAAHGPRLRTHVLFEALAEHFGVADHTRWPADCGHPGAPGAVAFERTHADRLGFHAFVQWLAWRQWQAVGTRARKAGLAIGVIADLAVGADPGGADSWSRPALLAEGWEVGAPPDALGPDGQAWGLPAWRPDALAEAGHEPFVELLSTNLAGAGGLRIDHVMALERLYWVPRGGSAADGAYVAYPFDDLLRIVCAASAEQRALIIGEDLGTVRPGLRERLAVAGVLSYRVAWFERDATGQLADPRRMPARAAVCASTHDLPTIDGWAAGLDLDERFALGLIDAPAHARDQAARRDDVARIDAGLERYGLTGADRVERLHRWLAVSSARLAIVQLEDVTGQPRQPNLPGTPDRAPNWRQRLTVPLESLHQLPRWHALERLFAARHAGRPR